MKDSLRFVLLGSLAMGLGATGPASAQGTVQPTPAPGPAVTTPAGPPPAAIAPGAPRTTIVPGTTARTDAAVDRDREVVDAALLEAGANSFTEGQARSRLEDAGFTAVAGLIKDDQGFWRGRAMQGGQMIDVAMDFRGRIAAAPNLAVLGGGVTTMMPRTDPSATVPSRPTPSITGARPDGIARPDGTPGNPPSTAVGRAVDRMQGQPTRPDGTPGNPPGTAAGRALDGTAPNVTTTNPPPPAIR
jgi:hypothetical protein